MLRSENDRKDDAWVKSCYKQVNLHIPWHHCKCVLNALITRPLFLYTIRTLATPTVHHEWAAGACERVQCVYEYDRVYVCVFRDRRFAGQNTIFIGDKLKSRGQYMENICKQINHQTTTLTTKTTTTKTLNIDRSRVWFVNKTEMKNKIYNNKPLIQKIKVHFFSLSLSNSHFSATAAMHISTTLLLPTSISSTFSFHCSSGIVLSGRLTATDLHLNVLSVENDVIAMTIACAQLILLFWLEEKRNSRAK